MTSPTHLLLLLLLFSHYHTAQAQPYAASVLHYGTEHGLAHREANAIIQDKQGFIWIATKGGLSRFDGKTFTTFNRERNGFAFEDIDFIAKDADGMLWLEAMLRPWEVMIFNPRTGQAQTFAEKFGQTLPAVTKSGAYGAMASSSDGTVYLTKHGPVTTLLSYHPKTGLQHTPFPQYQSLALCHATRRGTVWAIADNNIMAELHPDGRVLRQYKHSVRNLPIGLGAQNNEGLFFYFEYPGFYPYKAVYSIDEEGNQRQWPDILLGNRTSYKRPPMPFYLKSLGLVWDQNRLLDQRGAVLLDLAKQGFANLGGRGVFLDRSGTLWLSGNFGLTRVKLAPSRFKRLFYHPLNDPEVNVAIRGIQVIGNNLYVNREAKGLYKADRTGRVTQTVFETRDWGSMYGLAQDRQGRLVAGAHFEFLQSDTARRIVRFFPLPNHEHLSLWSFYDFSETHLLAGTEQGLRLIDARTGNVDLFHRYNQFPELAQAHTLHIGPDRQGTIWLCTTTGLYTFDPRLGITARYWSGGKGQYYLPSDNFQHFYHAPNGLFWLATASRGLVRWNRTQGQTRTFRRTDGLSNDNIYAVYADRRGRLWMSSDYGIMQFDPARQTTRTYLVEDGITNVEFNRISHFQEPNGRIYFGGINGLTTFDPRDFENERPPEPLSLYLMSFRQLNAKQGKVIDKTAEVQQSGRIRIPPGDGTSVLDFAFLNFDEAARNVYAYQLVGLNEGWQTLSEPSLRLSNLPYGDYTLQIKAQAASGQWSANTLTLDLVVVRPFYLSTWFVFLILALLIGGIAGWVSWRTWSHRQEQQRLQSEIKQATATISQQAEVLQQLDQTKSRFFSNITHEFRTPLSLILSPTEKLLQEAKHDAPTRQTLWSVHRNAGQLLQLVNQLLDLSKLEGGGMVVSLSRGNVAEFIEQIVDSFRAAAEQKGVSLTVRMETGKKDCLFDSDKWLKISSNIIANALKFTPVGGAVSVELTDSGEGTVCLAITDTGIGIRAEKVPHIFDRFYQVDDTHTRSYDGTGIGLALVKELIDMLGGTISVASEPGKGTTFTIHLPVLTALVGDDVSRISIPAPIQHDLAYMPEGLVSNPIAQSVNREMVLVVEDNEELRHFIAGELAKSYRVLTAANGAEGWELAQSELPDLVISDVMMPLMDGYELTHQLKTSSLTNHIGVILLSARAAHASRMTGLTQGADDYLTKPFHIDELRQRVHNLLTRQQTLRDYYHKQFTQPDTDFRPETLTDEFLRELHTSIDEQLDNPAFGVDELARKVGMSRRTLDRKLAAVVNQSANNVIRQHRLKRAAQFLLEGRNVSEAAYLVGYESPAHFSQIFKELFHKTPTEFAQK